ncbi:MAG TPA: H-NS histone family protein [Methylibium sp.]|uniref:H-NS histone family protein n=1 Tax=Methylibium sp. TaxID=2067992 RepID=UPI002DBD0748|nr:H-NS histone family protein [Methylibium sp.]HEU4459738.1 H-NS histone family protein [Methylibium sp.]
MPRTSRLTLERINAQIAELQTKADALREAERQDVIAKMQAAMAHYGITPAELRSAPRGKAGSTGPAKRSVTSKSKPARKRKTKGVIRFRDSEGNTWTGVGKRPNWYKAAIAAGKTPEDLAAR